MANDKKNEKNEKVPTTAPLRTNEIAADLKEEGFAIANPEELFYKCADPALPIKLGEDIPLGSVNVLRGIVLGRELRKPDPDDDGREDKDQYYYHVVLTKPAILYGRRDGQGNSPAHNCAPGFMAWIDERWDLQRMVNMLPRRDAEGRITSVFEVVVTPLRKQARQPKGTRWEIQLSFREIPAAKAGVPLLDMPADGVVQKPAPANPIDRAPALPAASSSASSASSASSGGTIDTTGETVSETVAAKK